MRNRALYRMRPMLLLGEAPALPEVEKPDPFAQARAYTYSIVAAIRGLRRLQKLEEKRFCHTQASIYEADAKRLEKLVMLLGGGQ